MKEQKYLVKRKKKSPVQQGGVRNISKPKTLVQAEDLLDYWNKQGLREHTVKTSAIYKNILKALTQLLIGNHPHFDRKFKVHEIRESIDSFVQAAIDPMVKPHNKTKLRRMSFLDFIYCPYHTKVKSKMSHYMIHEPEPINSCEDRYPEMTKALMVIWNREMRHGLKNGFSPTEKNLFRKASNRVMDMIDENKDKIQWLLFSAGAKDIAEALWRSIEETTNYNLSRVNIHWLSSDLTIAKFCDYLGQKGYVKAKNER
jgi:hypothetical protein